MASMDFVTCGKKWINLAMVAYVEDHAGGPGPRGLSLYFAASEHGRAGMIHLTLTAEEAEGLRGRLGPQEPEAEGRANGTSPQSPRGFGR